MRDRRICCFCFFSNWRKLISSASASGSKDRDAVGKESCRKQNFPGGDTHLQYLLSSLPSQSHRDHPWPSTWPSPWSPPACAPQCQPGHWKGHHCHHHEHHVHPFIIMIITTCMWISSCNNFSYARACQPGHWTALDSCHISGCQGCLQKARR